MPKSSLVLVLVAFLLTGLLIPTGASGSDQLWTEPAVVLEPHDGPNGQYASINGDGDLQIDLSSPGLNADAVTVISDLFYVSNEHEGPVAIWFSHAEMDEIDLTIDGQSAQDEDDPVTLEPGQQKSVGVSVDTSTRSPGELVLSEFTIHAMEPSDSSGGGSDGGSSGGSEDIAEGGRADEPINEPEDSSSDLPSGEDEVVFADGIDGSVEFRSLPTESADDLAGPATDTSPRPTIDAAPVPRTLTNDDQTRQTEGGDALVSVGDRLTLTGERSAFTTVDAIQPDGRVLRLIEIDVPPAREESPANVRLVVDRSSFDGTDPTEARIGRFTTEGWHLLDTKVMDADDQQVVLQARTFGFSTFAVFPDPAVSYEWEFADGRTAQAITVEEQFEDPGIQSITLNVTDADGRTSTAEYRVVANDRPSVSIETSASAVPGEPVTLRANVTNVVGNATVTWTFANGETVSGQSVVRSFEAGEHAVTVEVVDEYGASSRSSATLVVGGTANDGQVSIELFQLSLSVEERLIYAAILIFLFIAGLREWGSRGRRVRTR